MPKPYNEKDLKLPLDEILKNNGYFVVKEKSSVNSIKMSNNNDDSIIITRASNGHYMYFNPNEPNDRGNIFSFCKNRGIKLKELLSNTNKEDLAPKHNLSPKNKDNEKIKELIESFKQSKSLSDNNFFANKRMIDLNLLKNFNLKQDETHNILVPSFNLKKVQDKMLISQSGFVKYLSNPIKEDKEGKEYKNPLKALCYGNKGLELIKAEKLSMNDIKSVIIAESSIDALSFVELKGLNINECLLCSTNGTINLNSKELIKYFDENLKNASFNLAFDNDKKGKSSAKGLKELLKDKATINEPVLKDFNDDLFISKFLLLNKNFTLKELEANLDKNLLSKINELKKSNNEKALKLPLKVLKLIKPKIIKHLSKESLKKLENTLTQPTQTKGLSYAR